MHLLMARRPKGGRKFMSALGVPCTCGVGNPSPSRVKHKEDCPCFLAMIELGLSVFNREFEEEYPMNGPCC